MDILTIVLAILGSSSVTAVLVAYINRRTARAIVSKAVAETAAIELQTTRTETEYYRQRVEDTIAQMVAMEEQIKELKAEIGRVQDEYEQRIGSLHTKIDKLTDELDRANAALDVANNTIVELRLEVKAGNAIITDLRQEISQLLVDRAEKGG